MDQPYLATPDPGAHTLVVEGTLDETSAPRFREDLFGFIDAGAATSPRVVDLTRVEYLLSVAIAILASAVRHGEETGSPIRLEAQEGTIAARVLAICGLPYEETPAPSPASSGAGGGEQDTA